jgi:hypothetical protein
MSPACGVIAITVIAVAVMLLCAVAVAATVTVCWLHDTLHRADGYFVLTVGPD